MEILIVARTRMSGSSCCVGGLELATNRSVRLLQANGQNMPEKMPMEVGDVWEITYKERSNPHPPHVEDVLVERYNYLHRQNNLKVFLSNRIRAWEDSPKLLFDGKLCFNTNGSGFICEKGGIPSNSTGYWRPDQDLMRDDQNSKTRYIYPCDHYSYSLPFVGLAKPVERIPKGTLLRVSLARWWKPENAQSVEERCYLQLSGWYFD